MSRVELTNLKDDQLLASLRRATRREREATADVVAHLVEVEARRLYAREGFSSLFVYCVEGLKMSESQAGKRIYAGRAAREFPVIVELLSSGALHLSGVNLLRPHLTEENHRALLEAARGKSKRDIEKLLARWFPKPDAPEVVRRLPQPKVARPATENASDGLFAPTAYPATDADTDTDTDTHADTAPAPASIAVSPSPPPASMPVPPATTPDTSPASRGVVAPLAPARFKIQFTAGQALHDKLRLAQDLLRHQVPNGDVAMIVDKALTKLIEDVQHRRFGKRKKKNRPKNEHSARRSNGAVADVPASTGQPQPGPQPAPAPHRKSEPRPGARSSRHIPNDVKREVLARDGMRCAFVAPNGRRCAETGGLEFHHVDPHARGGLPTVDNVALFCKPHNDFAARQDFGSAFVDQRVEAAKHRPKPRRAPAAQHPPGHVNPAHATQHPPGHVNPAHTTQNPPGPVTGDR